ncbi:MAG: hypothetical protein Q8Q00_00530 [Dehalococcoidia bacterium]|nr:hypothetical protein [Dehalococcoidia bacterium]
MSILIDENTTFITCRQHRAMNYAASSHLAAQSGGASDALPEEPRTSVRGLAFCSNTPAFKLGWSASR